ncbi:hypothetical protein [Pseudomonas paralactis]
MRDQAERGAAQVRFEKREISGLNETDLNIIIDKLLDHLTETLIKK